MRAQTHDSILNEDGHQVIFAYMQFHLPSFEAQLLVQWHECAQQGASDCLMQLRPQALVSDT